MIDRYYQGLPPEEQRKIDQKAYNRYFNSFFLDWEEFEEDGTISYSSEMLDQPLTFNSWYGTEQHRRDIQFFLRNQKLKKLKEKADY